MTNKTEVEGPLLGGVLVKSIYSYGLAEDGNTLCIMVDMVDNTTAMISICPGERITCCTVT